MRKIRILGVRDGRINGIGRSRIIPVPRMPAAAEVQRNFTLPEAVQVAESALQPLACGHHRNFDCTNDG
jgi:hypothetical protein